MTATELIAVITAASGAIGTAIAAIITSIRKANDAASLNRQIAALDRWKLTARYYIAQLRGTLADRGIESPEPPPELELYEGD